MKVVALLSGGIDSAVAIYLMMKQGVNTVAINMDNRPFTDEKQTNKAVKLVEQLSKIFNKRIKMYVVPFGETIQPQITKNCNSHLQCVLCRRMMFRISERIAEKENTDAILTGESLGQVASQTLRNIKVEEQAVDLPIIRPLIGLDKVEIIDIAKKIGTYDISIAPGLCCTIAPNKPATHANLSDIQIQEEKMNINSIVKDAVKNAVVM